MIGGHWCGLVRVCGRVRDGGRAVREMRAAQGALAGFLAERKMLDKLCKSILDWKQGTTPTTIGTAPRMISRTAPDAGRLWQYDRRYTVRPARHLQAARCAGNLLR